MNRMLLLRMSAGAAVLLATGWAWAEIRGSKHDFADSASGREDTCGACHVPHRAEAVVAAPRWDPDADLTRRLGTAGRPDSAPGRGTTMCLSCHDGTIAPDVVNAVSIERFANKEHSGLFAAGHQTTNHPVGVRYPRVADDYQPASRVVATGAVALPGGRVECNSCHDPHDAGGHPYMLVLSNRRSALCLTCHRK